MFSKKLNSNPSYFIRLDDACPTNDLQKWDYIEELLSRFDIKPIVCITPENKHPVLIRSKYDDNFWNRVHRWQAKGWHIALHGWSHVFISNKGGIVPLNKFSEFAGVPYKIQLEKIRNGYKKLISNYVNPSIWVAPAHTFDKNTLKILINETPIRIISDGLSRLPYNQYGFLWMPQQLWTFKYMENGVWTLCLHPDMLEKEWVDNLFKDVENHIRYFTINLNEIKLLYASRRRSISDLFFFHSFFIKKYLSPIYRFLKKNWKR